MLIWILVAILAVGVVLSYVRGVKKGERWGTMGVLLCAIGLITVLGLKELSWVFVFILGAAVVLSYFGGVKKRESWGTMALLLCAVGFLAVLGAKMVYGPDAKIKTGGQVVAARQQQVAVLIGEALKGKLEPGSRILFLGADLERYWAISFERVQEGLSKGLEDSSWENAGYCLMSAERRSPESIWRAPEGFDALVSFAGFYPEMEELDLYLWPDPPLVAAYFPARGDLDQIRTWLSDGFLRAAVVKTERGSLKPYTPEQLPP